MRCRTLAGPLFLFIPLLVSPANADDDARNDPWSVTLYAGPATTKYVGAIVVSGFNFHPTAAAGGVDLSRRLIYLGGDLWIGADGQAVEYWFGHHDTNYATGLGFIVDDPFGIQGTRFSIYDGPSWDTDPAYTSIGYKEKVFAASRVRFLNYVSINYAVSLPHTRKWDVVFQIFHRSGMWGVYSVADDESTVVGFGIRYRF
jgi:hypothetical protein